MIVNFTPISLRVLVTRPSPSGELLCQRIHDCGGEAIFFPTIVFAPPPDPIALSQAILALDQYNWVIFVSPQAVRAVIKPLLLAWPNLPLGTQFAAIGSGTAEVLKESGYAVSAYPTVEASSKQLLSLAPFQEVINQKIMIIHGTNGLNTLAKTFSQRGARVCSVCSYERSFPSLPDHDLTSFLQEQKIDVIVATACANINHLNMLVSPAYWASLNQIPVIVVSERVKQCAHALGFQHIYLSSGGANNDALLECLQLNQYDIISIKRKKL